jgi:hypothetical protein
MSLASVKDNELSKFRGVDGHKKVAVTLEDDVSPLRFDEVSSSEMYLATGLVAATNSEAKWKIQKITITGAITSIKYASNDFDQIWDDRAALIYV